jgi:hypothetical protein
MRDRRGLIGIVTLPARRLHERKKFVFSVARRPEMA